VKAWVVVDLAFGDAGKGTIVDYLVRREHAELVVRFNGGAQAGHNVVTDDGRHHTFAQLGAGSFVPGCRSHLAETVILHPSAVVVEERWLARAGVSDAWARLTIAPGALVTTPFHQALGRLRELAREEPHGTCGVGVGETVRSALAGLAIRARDLYAEGHENDLADRVEPVRRALLEEARTLDARNAEELALLEDPGVTARWIESMRPLLDRASEIIREAPPAERVVLEGAQGVLLDEDWGFHPHTTWSRTTSAHAEAWTERAGFAPSEVVKIGVLRTYLTRHGPGPFPSETEALAALPEPHNRDDGWQGRFRRGWPDPILARYAIRATGGIDELAVTHVDALSFAPWRVVARHAEDVLDVPVAPHDLEARERLTRALAASQAVLEPAPNDEAGFLEDLERRLDVPVAIVSRGPRPADKITRTRGCP
jgi:adenylosuccinate synthase